MNESSSNPSYWETYFRSLPSYPVLAIGPSQGESSWLEIPVGVQSLSKGNPNNALILLAAATQEAMVMLEAKVEIAIQTGSSLIPIPDTGHMTLKTAAKHLLEVFRNHADHLPSPKCPPPFWAFGHSDVLIPAKVGVQISPDCNTLLVHRPEQLSDWSISVLKEAFERILSLPSEQRLPISESTFKVYRAIDWYKLPSEVGVVWKDVFDSDMDSTKSYFENGGDSIQAIRLIAKLRKAGFRTDLSKLMQANTLAEWVVERETGSSLSVDWSPGEAWPLSSNQIQIWTDWSRTNQKGVYHEQFLFELEGSVSPEKLRAAYQHIWSKYSQLRIQITQENGRFFQTVKEMEPDFRVLETDCITPLLERDLREGFQGPLMRCTLATIGNKHHLLWSHHHVLLDGWSVGRLITEFIQAVDEGSFHAEPAINHIPLLLQKESEVDLQEQEDLWSLFFQDRAPLSLPQQRSQHEGYGIHHQDLEWNGLREFCAEKGISVQACLLGSMFLTAAGLGAGNKLFCHSISSGRSLLDEHAEDAIGLFIRNISPGFDLRQDDSLRAVISRVQEDFYRAVDLELSPPELIHAHQTGIPDVLFVFENYPYEEIKGRDLHGKLVYNHELTGYPVTFLVMPSEQTCKLKLIYDQSRFSPEFIGAFSQKFIKQVQEIPFRFEQPVNVLEEELGTLSLKRTDYPVWYEVVDACLPASMAGVTCSGSHGNLPYSHFEQLKKRFRSNFKDLEPGSRVAVFGPKTLEFPALVYCIMRNGWVYVPLHHAWPQDRIAQTLDIAGCQHVVLTHPDVVFPVPGDIQVHTDVFSGSAGEAEMDYKPALSEAAYLLFTSGSTGAPKGVALSHGNLSSFLFGCRLHEKPQPYEVIFSFTNMGFDLSIFENVYGLYVGKPIHVIQNPEDLWVELGRHQAVLLNTVPSVLAKLQPAEIRHLSVVYTAGEPFPESTWQLLKTNQPDLVIQNWYGPTETTTYSTVVDLTNGFDASVGSALPNEMVFIVDANGRLQEDHLPGEIVIGGEGVALGYLNSVERKFISCKETRFYLTGDRGYKSGNRIFLMGRRDRQVKRLGQRFELSEVEEKMVSVCQEVNRAHYLQDSNGHFVLFLETAGNDKQRFEAILERYFPAYMIPDEVILLSAFPENNNGKLDSKALAQMALLQGFSSNETHDSAFLQKLKRQEPAFQQLRGNLGFIQQGGDSIWGLRLIGKLKQIGVHTDMGALLNAQTVNEWLDGCHQGGHIDFRPEEDAAEYDLTPIQAWFWNHYTGNRNHFNQSVLLELFLPVDPATCFLKVQETFQALRPLRQVYAQGWKQGLEPILLLKEVRSEAEITRVCTELQSSFDLERGPVAAAVVFSLGNRMVLFLSIHHFYCDGFTWRIVLDLLQQTFNGQVIETPDLAVWGRVANKVHHLAENSDDRTRSYFPTKILNPFQGLQICSYHDSLTETLEWDEGISQHFLKGWKSDRPLNERFLTLFLEAWMQGGRSPVTPFFETHGRQHEDLVGLSEAIGWFTQFYPITSQDYPETKEAISHYAKESLENLPDHGLAYMALEGWNQPPFPALLNFLGTFDENWGGLAQPMDLDAGPQVDANNPLLAYLEINAIVLQGRVKWMFRSHPGFDLVAFKKDWDSVGSKLGAGGESGGGFYVDEGIGKDDLDTIADLLNL